MAKQTTTSITAAAIRNIKRNAIPINQQMIVYRTAGGANEVDMEELCAAVRQAVEEAYALGLISTATVMSATTKPRNNKPKSLGAIVHSADMREKEDREEMTRVLGLLKDKCGMADMRALVERNSGATTIKSIPFDAMKKVTRAAKITLAAVRRRHDLINNAHKADKPIRDAQYRED